MWVLNQEHPTTNIWDAVSGAAKTEEIHKWLRGLPDNQKQRFAINWSIPYSVFNVACKIYPGGSPALQGINWFKIHKSRDLGLWSHGGAVYPL